LEAILSKNTLRPLGVKRLSTPSNKKKKTFLFKICKKIKFSLGKDLENLVFKVGTLELSVVCCPVRFLLLFPSHAIVIIYLYCVLIHLVHIKGLTSLK
jgi:hypothetical protein